MVVVAAIRQRGWRSDILLLEAKAALHAQRCLCCCLVRWLSMSCKADGQACIHD